MVNLSSGTATTSTASLTVGTHVITATYSGDSNHAGSSGTLTPDQAVGMGATTTSLVSSANPSVFGSSVTFTATVAPSAATGHVQFYADGSTLDGPISLLNGIAGISTASLAIGTHVITATYSGDVNYVQSTGMLVPDQVVSAACTQVSDVNFSFLPAVPKVGQSVSFTATLTGGTPPITYTWDFGHGTNVVTTASTIVHSFPLLTTVHTYNVTLSAANACTSPTAPVSQNVTVWPYGIYLPLIFR